MPLYMDRHDLQDVTAADIAAAHMRDLEVQDGFGVRFVTYWFEEGAESGFCLVEARTRRPLRQPIGQPMGCFRRTSSRSIRPSCVASSDASTPILPASHMWRALSGPSSSPTWSTPLVLPSNWEIVQR